MIFEENASELLNNLYVQFAFAPEPHIKSVVITALALFLFLIISVFFEYAIGEKKNPLKVLKSIKKRTSKTAKITTPVRRLLLYFVLAIITIMAQYEPLLLKVDEHLYPTIYTTFDFVAVGGETHFEGMAQGNTPLSGTMTQLSTGISYAGNFLNGSPDGQGTLEYFDDNGNECETTLFLKYGKLEGLMKSYVNSKMYMQAYMKEGKWEGQAITYYPNGKIKSRTTKHNGEYDGIGEYYFENGKLQSRNDYSKGILKFAESEKTIRVGKLFYNSGNLLSECLVDDSLTGLLILYREDSSKELELEVENGLIKDFGRIFYTTGQIKYYGMLNGNKVPDGEGTYYYENGNIYRQGTFNNGKFVLGSSFSDIGEPTDEPPNLIIH